MELPTAVNLEVFSKQQALLEILILLVIIGVLAVVVSIVVGINGQRITKRAHKTFNRRIDTLEANQKEMLLINRKLLIEIKLCKEQVRFNSSGANNKATSSGGNQRGGHQTVNVNAPGKDFQQVLFDSIGEMRKALKEEITTLKTIAEAKDEQIKSLEAKMCRQPVKSD